MVAPTEVMRLLERSSLMMCYRRPEPKIKFTPWSPKLFLGSFKATIF